jgi:toxin ParE1/3/4
MPEPQAEYRLAPEAERDLEGIWRYTFEEWGLEQANRYVDDITAAFAQLAASPTLGVPCDHIREGYRRSRVGRHAIYFRPTNYGIAVIRILHDRMQSTRHL